MEKFRAVFEGTLTNQDVKRNIPFKVEVLAGTTCFSIHFTYAPHVVDGLNNLLTLTVFDPAGFRGAGHRQGDEHFVTIGQAKASPGFVPGPVPAGVWTVVIDTHLVMPGPQCTFKLEVSGTDECPVHDAPAWPVGHTAKRGPGWYRGDLHAHTIHSDARWDIGALLAFGRSRQLDFMTLTDHNTVSGLAEFVSAGCDDLLTLPGMELTTFWGHALTLGLMNWTDWRTEPGKRSMEQIEHEVTARGGVFVIAHPLETGDPVCTGCAWVYSSMMPGTARVVEVWNGDWVSGSNNSLGLQEVYRWLNNGCKLALTAGNDNHGFKPELMHYGFNNVYAQDLSEKVILRAVRAGHLYISSGPVLKMTAGTGGVTGMLGDVLDAGGSPITLNAEWQGGPSGTQLELIVDGNTHTTCKAEEQGSAVWNLDGEKAHWALATLSIPGAKMLAITNPIFFDGRE
jgi:hypothetical protein